MKTGLSASSAIGKTHQSVSTPKEGTHLGEILKGIQTYIRTEILGIYGAPNYRNTRKANKQLDKHDDEQLEKPKNMETTRKT